MNQNSKELLLYLAGIAVAFAGLYYLLLTAGKESATADKTSHSDNVIRSHTIHDAAGTGSVPVADEIIIPWENLFDACDLSGWAVIERPAKVSVRDSSIVLNMTAFTSRHAFVRTEEKYSDFIFEVEYRRDSAMESGILFRSEDAPDTAFTALLGYMVKIDSSPAQLWTGGVVLDYGNGLNWLHSLEGDDRARHAEKAGGEWNHLRIEAIGEEIKVWVNGIPTAHLADDKFREGYIAFIIHYLKKDETLELLEIAYRNPRVITVEPEKYSRPMDLSVRDTKGKLEVTYFR
ncbi:MAG: DUF1080 domain-containing protein [Bacteroidia bacterium]